LCSQVAVPEHLVNGAGDGIGAHFEGSDPETWVLRKSRTVSKGREVTEVPSSNAQPKNAGNGPTSSLFARDRDWSWMKNVELATAGTKARAGIVP